MIVQLLLAVNFFVAGHAWTTANCPQGLARNSYLKVFKDKCYLFELFKWRSQRDAEEFCHEDGGFLVTVPDQDVQDFIHETLHGLWHHRKYSIWLGLKFDYGYNKFLWVDGREMDYENLKEEGQTSSPCVGMEAESGKWVRYGCDEYPTKRFVCEYPVLKEEFDKVEFPTSISTDDCGLGYDDERVIMTFGDRCYLFFLFSRKTFDEARNFCKDLGPGGDLVSVESKKVNFFLQHHLFITHRFQFDSESVFIGLRHQTNKGEGHEYKWTDGTVVNFTNFRTTEDFQHECFAMSAMSGEWEGVECGIKGDEDEEEDKRYFICESDSTLPKTTGKATTATTTIIPTRSPTSVRSSSSPSTSQSTSPKASLSHPTSASTNHPTSQSTHYPTSQSTDHPTSQSTHYPTSKSTDHPTSQSTHYPTSKSTDNPTSQSTNHPTSQSTDNPTSQRTDNPTSQSTNYTTSLGTGHPISSRTGHPIYSSTGHPTSSSTGHPTSSSTSHPIASSSGHPTTPSTGHQTSSSSGHSIYPSTRHPTSPSTVRPTCPSIVCTIDCGLNGYKQDPNTGCMECDCNME